MKNFALIGAAGYVAPRHMQAIKATNNSLVTVLDPNDSIGVIDSYFPKAQYFSEFERFDRYVDKLRRTGASNSVHYVSVCSPNYLHDSHVRFALRSGADAICEKPVVLNPWNIDGLQGIEAESGKRVYTVLQLRLHPAIVTLRNKVMEEEQVRKHDVDLTYVTSRGGWYLHSWKGDERKSGGIATNIGVHFFDMLHFIFGAVQRSDVHYLSVTRAAGYLEYEHARVRWFLSISGEDVPVEAATLGKRTYRSITCDDQEIEFSEGFGDLHTLTYEDILQGRGFGLEQNRVAIETVASIRTAKALGLRGDYHPFLRNLL